MAPRSYSAFPPGFRTIDGRHLNDLFQGNETFAPNLGAGTIIQGAVITGGGGSFTTLAASGVATLTSGLFSGGARTFTLTTVAAAGNSQGTATAITTAASVVVITVTASTEGVKLPSALTGRRVEIYADPAVGVKVYPSTNQKIGAAATNSAYTLVKNTACTFQAINTTTWIKSV